MKKILQTILLMLIGLSLLFSCNNGMSSNDSVLEENNVISEIPEIEELSKYIFEDDNLKIMNYKTQYEVELYSEIPEISISVEGKNDNQNNIYWYVKKSGDEEYILISKDTVDIPENEIVDLSIPISENYFNKHKIENLSIYGLISTSEEDEIDIYKTEVIIISRILPKTELPVIYIDVENGENITSKEEYKKSKVSIKNNEQTDFYEEVKIRGRGNTSWFYDKKPYKLKFNEKTSLFGLEKAKEWILLANWQDPTMIFNTITFKIGDILGIEFNHHVIPVELVINGEYMGSYSLTEQNEVGKGCVDIDKDSGYLCEIDTYFDEDPKFKTNNFQLPVMIKSPELKNITDVNSEGYKFIVDSLNELDEIVYSIKSGKEVSKNEEKLFELINEKSFATYLLVNEIVRNTELCHPKSSYIYKDKGSEICMGPLWDFDWAWGHDSSLKSYFNKETDYIGLCPFFNAIRKNKKFNEVFTGIWNKNFDSLMNVQNVILKEASKVEKSFYVNKNRWPENPYNEFIEDYEELINEMVDWYSKRLEWLDMNINNFKKIKRY